MIGRPLREEAGLAAPVSPPDRDGAAPEPTPPELFGADAEGALDEVGAGEVLEQRGALACFAAEGMAGYGSGGGGKVSEAGGLAHPVVRGFDSPSESGTSGQPGHGADIDLAAPGTIAAGGVALSAAGAAEMPGLLRLSTQEKALKERRRLQE